MFRSTLVLTLLLVLAAAIGCSGGGVPIMPGNVPDGSTLIEPPKAPTPSGERGHHMGASHSCWGLWQFMADPVEKTLNYVTVRSAGFHLNALPFLEPPPLVFLSLESLDFIDDTIEADIGLRHPFPGLDEFTGFDVCGILITNGTVTGYGDGLIMSGEGDTRLMNPDGYSRWWNPTEFPYNPTGDLFSYKDGLLGAPYSYGHYNCNINAYKYFADVLAADDDISALTPASRGIFSPGKKNIRHYKIELGADGLVFNYAVDASWEFPTGDPPWIAPDDFPDEANRPEPYNITVSVVENSLYHVSYEERGGTAQLMVYIYDWFNAGMNELAYRTLCGIPPAECISPTGAQDDYATFQINLDGSTLTQSGQTELLLICETEQIGYQGQLSGTPISSYFTFTIDIDGLNPFDGWAVTFGGPEFDYATSLSMDSSGNIYLTGSFKGTADFDPGPETANRTSSGDWDAFLVKLNPYGEFLWVRTWGGNSEDRGNGVSVDQSGAVYITGIFSTDVDFDPGPAPLNRSSHGHGDVFLSKFDSGGNFIWVRTWGGIEYDSPSDVVVGGTPKYIYITGYYQDTVEFDPGPATDWHTSNGQKDVFLCKYNTNGDFEWARTWGGTTSFSYTDSGKAVHTGLNDGIFIAGYFAFGSMVDFDPGPLTEYRLAVGQADAFLSAFDDDGNFMWVATWGSTGPDICYGADTDDSGNVYVAGEFYGSFDFDPGTGTEIHSSNGQTDCFVSKFAPNGDFLWARTHGNIHSDSAQGVAAYKDDCVYITGSINPSTGSDPGDILLRKYDSFGNFIWTREWDGSYWTIGMDIITDNYGSIFVAGYYHDLVDFDPGLTVDEHTSNGSADVFLIKVRPIGYW